MSKKFTEEQYNTLVEIQEEQYPFNLFITSKEYDNSIGYTVSRIDIDLQFFIFKNNLGNEAIALMNPLTREWAHEQFVEEEKKYVWRLKTDNNIVASKVANYWYLDQFPTLNRKFTEAEIENSPFKPEWFDKEEV